MWETWHKHHSRCEAVPPLLEMNKEDMYKYIGKFLVEVRRKECTGETLQQFVWWAAILVITVLDKSFRSPLMTY